MRIISIAAALITKIYSRDNTIQYRREMPPYNFGWTQKAITKIFESISLSIHQLHANRIFRSRFYSERMALRYKITGLERDKDSLAEQLKEAQRTIKRLRREIERLNAELTPAKIQEAGYNIRWSWTTKVIYILRNTGLPLRVLDIMDELQKIDDVLFKKPNPATYLLAVIAQAVHTGRILPYKSKAFVGDFYVLPDWSSERK